MNNKEERKYFHEIDANAIKNTIVIIDIDGTVVCSSRSDASDEVRHTVRALEENNTVYAFSNNFNGTRSRAVAKDLGLPYIESPYRKPNPKIINYIKKNKEQLVMIGDKYLTDYLFARFAGGTCIHVRRYTCASDRAASRAACLLDDAVYAVAKLFRIAR